MKLSVNEITLTIDTYYFPFICLAMELNKDTTYFDENMD